MQLDAALELQQKVLALMAKRPEYQRTLQAAIVPTAYAADTELAGSPHIAVGITGRPGGGYQLAIRLKHKALKGLAEVASAHARGEADVRYIGRVRALMSWHQSRHRPMQIGTSIAHHLNTAGSMGAWVRKPGDKDYLGVLSNSHVLVCNNRVDGQDHHAIQPGRADGGKHPRDRIGTLDAWVPINFSGVNDKDCAVARLDPDEKAKYEAAHDYAAISGIGPVKGIRDNLDDLLLVPNSVVKVGADYPGAQDHPGLLSSLPLKPLGVEYQGSPKVTREATFTGSNRDRGVRTDRSSRARETAAASCATGTAWRSALSSLALRQVVQQGGLLPLYCRFVPRLLLSGWNSSTYGDG